jgi:hypothetical protein
MKRNLAMSMIGVYQNLARWITMDGRSCTGPFPEIVTIVFNESACEY